jgi:hypothetical protein
LRASPKKLRKFDAALKIRSAHNAKGRQRKYMLTASRAKGFGGLFPPTGAQRGFIHTSPAGRRLPYNRIRLASAPNQSLIGSAHTHRADGAADDDREHADRDDHTFHIYLPWVAPFMATFLFGASRRGSFTAGPGLCQALIRSATARLLLNSGLSALFSKALRGIWRR